MATKKVIFQNKYTTTANIAAGGDSNEIFISENDQFQYKKFDTIMISNRDTITLQVYLNGSSNNAIEVQPNSVITADDQSFKTFTVHNPDAATAHTAGKVTVFVQKTKEV